jgi:hypothetical protein
LRRLRGVRLRSPSVETAEPLAFFPRPALLALKQEQEVIAQAGWFN